MRFVRNAARKTSRRCAAVLVLLSVLLTTATPALADHYESAKAGHYLGNKRMADMQENVANYVNKSFGDQWDRLGQGAGINMQPDASTFGLMTGQAVGADVGQVPNLMKTVTNEGGGGLFDIAKGLLDTDLGKEGVAWAKDKVSGLFDGGGGEGG